MSLGKVIIEDLTASFPPEGIYYLRLDGWTDIKLQALMRPMPRPLPALPPKPDYMATCEECLLRWDEVDPPQYTQYDMVL